MKILITGNMGYVGSSVFSQLRASFPSSTLVGFGTGYFANCLSGGDVLPECNVNVQHFGDMRKFTSEILRGVDAVVHLAGISNDPIGNKFEQVTYDINHRSSIALAEVAKGSDVTRFIFATAAVSTVLLKTHPGTSSRLSDLLPRMQIPKYTLNGIWSLLQMTASSSRVFGSQRREVGATDCGWIWS